MELRISDLLEGLQESSIQLETKKYARPERVLALTKEKLAREEAERRRAGRGKRVRRAVLAVLLLALLGGGLYLGLARPELLRQLLPRSAESQALPTESAEAEETPAPSPEPPDAARSEALVGDYTASGAYATLGDYMVTVRRAVLDDNGIGVLELRIKNALGHGFVPGEDGEFIQEKEPFLSCTVSSSLGKPLKLVTHGVYEERSDTAIDFVYYLTPEEPLNWTEDVLLQFLVSWPSEEESERARITIPAAVRVPAQRFYDAGLLASVSPVGMMLCFTSTVRDSLIGDPDAAWDERFETERLELHFSDGSVYVVRDGETDRAACASTREQRDWIAFDRLVDTDMLTELVLSGQHVIRIAGNSTPAVSRYSYTLVKAGE